MRWLGPSLFVRISAIFLALLLVLSLAHLWIATETARDFAQESDQSLNRYLAKDLVPTFAPAVAERFQEDAVDALIGRMMVFNPRVEIYLLDIDGTILAAHSGGRALVRRSVALPPIRRFLAEAALPLPIRGDDPRSLEDQVPFSVAPITIGGKPGYLYLILGGEQYRSIAAMVEESYIIRNSLIGLLAMFLLIGVAGLTVFFVLTKRLRAMTAVVRQFERGSYGQRVGDMSPDEIGQLGRAFNDMADRLVRHMQEMQNTDALRRELVANVSHDLRSPLASIQGYLETILMKDEHLPQSERRRFLETIYRNVTRLNTLVSELFELSKLDARQVEPVLEPFSLSELVQDVVLKFQPLAQDKRIALESDFARDIPPVIGDIGMIERVLSNLIDNALHYTPPGGRVLIALEPGCGEVWARVRDNGIGIDAQHLAHVFERFYRADKSRSRGQAGIGIGLAIAERIMHVHGRELTLKSAPGEGSEFAFSLPVRPRAA